MTDDLLMLGIQAATAGDLPKARKYLVRLVQDQPFSEQGWLYLGHCLDDLEKKKYCYQRVLTLNPANRQAREALATLSASGAAASQAQVPLQAQPLSEHMLGKLVTKMPNPRLKRVVMLAGIALVLVFCSGVLWALGTKAGLRVATSFHFPAALVLFPSATPSLTPTSIYTLTPTVTGTPTHTPRPTFTQYSSATPIPSLTPDGSTANDPHHWDLIIKNDPKNADAYYGRARAIYETTRATGSQQIYIANLNDALRDVNAAIALKQDVGNYYALRQSIYFSRAAISEYVVDNQYLTSIALDNAYKANELGETLDQYPQRIIISDLIYTNQCQKALQEIENQLAKLPTGDSSTGGLLHLRSQAYACLGRLTEALQSINASMFNNQNMDYKNTLKVQYLMLLGRYAEALPILNNQLCNCALAGWRYYWRAEIYFKTGKKDLAQADLDSGMSRTWMRGGMLPYVQAQLALDDGRKADAIHFLQLAEATFDPTYNPLRLKIRQQLASLDAQPLSPTPSINYPATPIP